MTFHPSDPALRVPAAPVWVPIARHIDRGRPRITNVVVRRSQSTPNSATMRTPNWMLPHRRVQYFEDGNGRLGIVCGDTGNYMVGANGAARVITLPKPIAILIPYGTHVVHLNEEHGMLVLDTAQFPQVSE